MFPKVSVSSPSFLGISRCSSRRVVLFLTTVQEFFPKGRMVLITISWS